MANTPDSIQQVRAALSEAPSDARYAFEILALELTRFRGLFEMVRRIQNRDGGVFDGVGDLSLRDRTPEEERELMASLSVAK